MEFLSHSKVSPPKNLYPCLATITISPSADRSRRLSSSSLARGGGEDDNALRRVISGGRRKGSFGPGTGGAEEGRKSFQGAARGEEPVGKWYWRVQAGATDTHLVLLPLSQPPNPLLTVAPQPLSAAMPAHSTTASQAQSSMPGGANEREHPTEEGESFTSKLKHLFRGHKDPHKADTQTHSDTNEPTHGVTESAVETQGTESTAGETATSVAPSSTTTAVEDHIIDQTGRGQQMPTPEANRIGATNLNANAETSWPGMIKGEKLGAVTIDLRGVDSTKVVLGGGKKGEGSWVIVPVNTNFGYLVHAMLDPLGKHPHDYPKSGTVRFDFDKDWIGAKGEAELLQYHIMTALENLPKGAQTGQRDAPQSSNLQLGQGTTAVHDGTAPAPAGSGNVELGREVPIDQ